jgi:hypothetical protein
MSLQLTVVAENASVEAGLVQALQDSIKDYLDLTVEAYTARSSWGHIVFIDSKCKNLDLILDEILGSGKGRAIFLIASEQDPMPQALLDHRVDDVLVYPFRSLEVMSKLKYYHQILMWDEVSRINTSFSELIESLHDDLKLAERIQKARLPSRFPKLKGMKVTTRYLAGGKSGGDHFDIAESKDGQVFSIILSDSSSYGLSSALLAVIMKAAMKLNSDATLSSIEMVKKIQEELVTTLSEKDSLSLFYGTVSRKDYQLRFLNLGSSTVFYASPGKPFTQLPNHGHSISRKSGLVSGSEGLLRLEPGARLVLVSDGIVEAAGDHAAVLKSIESLREEDPKDSLNELIFKVKSKVAEDELPAQDCTAIILDIDKKLLRLAG